MSLNKLVDIHHRHIVIGNKLQFYCSGRQFTGNVSGWYSHKGARFVILQSLCLNPGNPTGLTALKPWSHSALTRVRLWQAEKTRAGRTVPRLTRKSPLRVPQGLLFYERAYFKVLTGIGIHLPKGTFCWHKIR